MTEATSPTGRRGKGTESLRHVLTELDTEARTAVCSICGPVTNLKRKAHRGKPYRWRCRTSWLQDPGNYGRPYTPRTPRTGEVIQYPPDTPRLLVERLRTYGLTLEQYEKLVELARGRCGICKKKRVLHIDHDHRTGKVRGLLCSPCNQALGIFGDTRYGLARAMRYLTRSCATDNDAVPTDLLW
jgi:Recombination endonuclease VII